MDIHEALLQIRLHLKRKNALVFTEHFHAQVQLRSLDDIFLYVLWNGSIVGIAAQDHNLYKTWFTYTSQKDLVIIFRLADTGLKLITLYVCDIWRRKR